MLLSLFLSFLIFYFSFFHGLTIALKGTIQASINLLIRSHAMLDTYSLWTAINQRHGYRPDMI